MAVPGRGAGCAGGSLWGGARGSLRSGCTQSTSEGAGWEVQEMQQMQQMQLSPGFAAAVLLRGGCGRAGRGSSRAGPALCPEKSPCVPQSLVCGITSPELFLTRGGSLCSAWARLVSCLGGAELQFRRVTASPVQGPAPPCPEEDLGQELGSLGSHTPCAPSGSLWLSPHDAQRCEPSRWGWLEALAMLPFVGVCPQLCSAVDGGCEWEGWKGEQLLAVPPNCSPTCVPE